MKTDHTLDPSRLREVLAYDPDTGVFRWKASGRVAGSLAGPSRRRQIEVDGVARYANRMAWAYVTGEWPAGQVDHINGDRDDNRYRNLRVLPGTAENKQNQSRGYSNNRTGVLGVSEVNGRFRARIMVDGRSRSLGHFDTVDEAAAAYVAAKRKLHPFWEESA